MMSAARLPERIAPSMVAGRPVSVQSPANKRLRHLVAAPGRIASCAGVAAKVSATGQTLVYCGYIGGAGFEFAYDVALDAERYACVTGDTNSTEVSFPLVGGLDTTQNGGFDVFIAKVGTARGALIFCGFILFDTSNIMRHYPLEAYVPATIALYLDFVNLFIYILSLLGRRRD